jgi:hypothetical protein
MQLDPLFQGTMVGARSISFWEVASGVLYDPGTGRYPRDKGSDRVEFLSRHFLFLFPPRRQVCQFDPLDGLQDIVESYISVVFLLPLAVRAMKNYPH